MEVSKKKKYAQQLLEFLLVVPFMIIILGIVTEYAYALNVNMTLNEGLKSVTSALYGEIKPAMSENDIKTLVAQNLTDYLTANNVPISSISIKSLNIGQTTILMTNYTYTPAFTLPKAYFKIMPDKFNLFAAAAVPDAFLMANNYNNTINSSTLDKIWSSSADFSTQDSFNASKKGILKNPDGRENMLFLVSTTEPGLAKPFALVSWDGTTKKDGGGNLYVFDNSTGLLNVCSAVACAPASTTLTNFLNDNNIYNVVFVHDLYLQNDLTKLSTEWIKPPGATDISEADGVLKKAVSMVCDTYSCGNFDNIDVSQYNATVAPPPVMYKMSSFGSRIVVYTVNDTPVLVDFGTVSNIDYAQFGSRVN